MALLNLGSGLSELGKGVANVAGGMALEAQRSMLNQESLKLADQLQTIRESTGRQEAAGIAEQADTRRFGHEVGLETTRVNAENTRSANQIAAHSADTRAQIDKLPDEVRTAVWFKNADPQMQRAYMNAIQAKAGMPPWALDMGADIPSPSAGGTVTPTKPSDAAPPSDATPPDPNEPPKPAPSQKEGQLLHEPTPNQTARYNEDVLKNKPAQVQAEVKAMVEGRKQPPTSFASSKGYWQGMVALANQYDHSFDEASWKARVKTRQSFAPGGFDYKNIVAMNTAIGHAGDLAHNFDALKNFGGFPGATSVNSVVNDLQESSGDPRQTKAKSNRDALAAEARKVFAGSGGGGLTELEKWEKNFPVNGSREQQIGAIQEFTTLMKSRMDSVVEGYNRAMGLREDTTTFMSPKARKTFEALERGQLPERGEKPTTEPALPPRPSKVSNKGWEGWSIKPVGGESNAAPAVEPAPAAAAVTPSLAATPSRRGWIADILEGLEEADNRRRKTDYAGRPLE